MQRNGPIVVVGASLAGLRAAEALREEGHEGPLTLVGEEASLPYDRPPLTKNLLRGECSPESIGLRRAEGAEFEIRSGCRAEYWHRGRSRVVLTGGEELPCEGLVVATGARARRLPLGAGLRGVHYLRTIEDALQLRSELEAGPRVVVIGGGVLGVEAAASCRSLGLEVSLVEVLRNPMQAALGREIAEVCGALAVDHGVQLHCGAKVEEIEGAGRVESVVLDGGRRLQADLVIVGVGAEPNTEWLEGSGLVVSDGVVCDEYCAASLPDVVAAGDVARWAHPSLGSIRVEHWTNAAEQARAAARRLLHGAPEPGSNPVPGIHPLSGSGTLKPYAPVPYFWSDQFGVKIQLAGRPRAGDRVQVVHGSPDERRFVAFLGRGDRLTGVFAMRRQRFLFQYAELLEQGCSWEDALSSASGS